MMDATAYVRQTRSIARVICKLNVRGGGSRIDHIGGAKEDAGAEYDLDRCLRLSCCDEHEESYGVIV